MREEESTQTAASPLHAQIDLAICVVAAEHEARQPVRDQDVDRVVRARDDQA